ncbi:hypothetical protein RUM8411_04022 [Ruegeria meonggei]|uniref:DUF3626 domain-containing protein n=2 Tax=Ruegeria meonggei TaxID=1446476 RepID=A0A1X7AAD8_9RHOB|nr:hypothetical protein RUM8411_04022 [Ruegeria meonggei]
MLPEPAQNAIDHVRLRSHGAPVPHSFRVTINFHPDALQGTGWMIEALAKDGIYYSQFEKGSSNGGLTAHQGGDRWIWESRMFGAAYDNAEPDQRPKYGALNHLNWATGGSPRFGSCHLRMRFEVLQRSTFCYPDSYFDPVNFGVADRMNLPSLAAENISALDELDNYIEAHVHGPLIVKEDVEAAAFDACYKGTEIEVVAKRLGCPIRWHSGFRMDASRILDCATYRDEEAASLAYSLLENGVLTPRQIGLARKYERADEQTLKRVWHCVAKFGNPNGL